MPEAAFTKSDEAKAFISLTLFHGTILMKRCCLNNCATYAKVQCRYEFATSANCLQLSFMTFEVCSTGKRACKQMNEAI